MPTGSYRQETLQVFREGESPGTGWSEMHWGQFISLLKAANILEKVLTHLHKGSPFF